MKCIYKRLTSVIHGTFGKSPFGGQIKLIVIGLCYVWIVTSGTMFANAAPAFEDISLQAGIDLQTNSFGISWGDVNGDGYPDFYMSNHFLPASLYLNLQDGTFEDVAASHDIHLGHRDVHGASWGDFDNDGDQDLLTAVGGFLPGGLTPDTPFFVNQTGALTLADPGVTGLTYALSDRTPYWLDENNDGLLDVLMVSRPRIPGFNSALLRQIEPDVFADVTTGSGLEGYKGASGLLIAGPNSPAKPDIWINRGNYLRWNGTAWQEMSSSVLGSAPSSSDIVHGDVNGDGLLDLYIVREGNRSQFVTSSTTVQVAYFVEASVVGSIDIVSDGGISIINSLEVGRGAFRLGSGEARIDVNATGPITLLTTDPDVLGEPVINLNTSLKIYVWYTQVDLTWHFRIGKTSNQIIEFEVQTSQPIQDVQTANIDFTDTPLTNRLYINNGLGGYTWDKTAAINGIRPSRSAVLADLDNDMDLDLYIVNRNPLDNPPNQLFEGQGDGSFIEVAAAGGAAGPVIGSGESVSTADYDQDGFLDLLVTNGASDLLAEPYPGPVNLYRNLGNQNHWLEIDLEGINTNRDGTGALVEVLAGGKKQVRFRDGGMHAFAQNHRRLHFGLGPNTVAEEVTISWPYGGTQRFTNVPADQIIRIYEEAPVLEPGAPVSLIGGKDGVYLWKDTYDGPYYLRTIKSDAISTINVSLLSDGPLAGVNLLIPSTLVEWQESKYGFTYRASLSDETGGVDFSLFPGGLALLAVDNAGTINPRQIKTGTTEYALTPAGWILDSAQLASRPTYDRLTDPGLFFGLGRNGNDVEFRWNSPSDRRDGNLRVTVQDVLNSDFHVVALEPNDVVQRGVNWIDISGKVRSGGWDGLDLRITGNTMFGFSYDEDGIFPRKQLVNGGALGEPNAYRVPMPSPDGEPDYDRAADANLYMWRNSPTRWKVRVTAGGGGGTNYAGEIVSDQPFLSVTPRNIESNDTFDASDPKRIRFNLTTAKAWFDGFDFAVPDNARLTLYMDIPVVNPESVIRIGGKKWPVDSLPLILVDAAGVNAIPAPVPVTGQLVSFGLGDDGDLQEGVGWPAPRFTDNNDGTVTDNLTGLIWLQFTRCLGQVDWSNALNGANSLTSGMCGLIDNSQPGDWRIPNARELLSIIDFNNRQPAIAMIHPFLGLEDGQFHWSSSTTLDNPARAWGVQVAGGNLERRRKDVDSHPITGKPHYAWPVKNAQ